MAAGKQTPRQRMINMMYLVLTALLALNVSKEVLNSFFEVNKGIERTTSNFNSKNGDTYADFDNAVSNNPVKYQEVRDKAYSIKKKADALVDSLQKMKYNLVLAVDKKVYLGAEQEIRDEDGDLIEEKAVLSSWEDLSDNQKNSLIGYLSAKDNRDQSGSLFYNKKSKAYISGEGTPATKRKEEMESLKKLLLSLSGGNVRLQNSISETFDLEDRKQKDGKSIAWEYHNFYDMPAVGALTLLSKMQSDIRNAEANVIDYLKKDIDAKSLKFTAAEGIQIPKSNFVLRGDTFRAEIFITANNPDQNPDIYVGEYDSIGPGNYQMRGEEGVDYEAVRVINGKGMFATRTKSEGVKKWGGLIAMKTETGTKIYPFGGEYLVAAKTAVVSPINMNVLYLEVDNPLKVSVPGYTAGEITAVINNGKVSATKKSLGEWSARPSKKGKAMVSLYANVEGKRTKMGDMPFRVKEVPPPKAKVDFVKNVNGSNIISKMDLLNAGGVQAQLKDFDFKGVRYIITSFRLMGVIKGEQTARETKGGQFTSQMEGIIKNTRAGNTITISKIKAKRIDYKNNKEILLDPLILDIK